MNEKHLLWHIFNYMEPYAVENMIGCMEGNKASFSKEPQQGEITVATAFKERYEAYKKAKRNG